MKKKMRLVIFASILPVITACNSSTTPQNSQIETPEATLTASSSRRSVDSGGGTLQFGTATIDFKPNAIAQQAWVEIDKLPAPQNELDIPAVNEVNSRFIMGRVANRKLIGVYRLRSNAVGLSSMATLTMHLGGSNPQPGTAVEEVFIKNNTTGVVDNARFANGEKDLSLILAFPERYDQGQLFDKTIYVYRAARNDYSSTCVGQGGNTLYGFCSFAGKTISSQADIQTQAVSKTFAMVSWNVGNVSTGTCGALADPVYLYKLCQQSVLRAVSDKLLSIEQQYGKPKLIFLQELWHGNCKYINDSNPDGLCYGSSANKLTTHSIDLILGRNNLSYGRQCSPTKDASNSRVILNGYECIAIDTTYFQFALSSTFFIQPDCVSNPDPLSKYDGADTGFVVSRLKQVATGTLMDAVNTHLIGFNNSTTIACQKTQLTALNSTYSGKSIKFLIAGDFNIDPYKGIGETTLFNNLFTAYGAPADPNKLGNILDNPAEDTGFYVNGNKSLDHVISNFLRAVPTSGGCQRLPNLSSGTDHTPTRCVVEGLF